MKIRSLVAAGSLGAVASLGALGVAGAATPPASGGHRAHLAARIHAIAQSGALPASFSCATASTLEARISMAETRLDARLSRGPAAEQAASAAGDTTRADRIALRIAEGNQLKGDLTTVSNLIGAKCG